MKELGERLRRLRESVKLSQVKMAELLGVKQSSINRYEQGQSAPSLETLVRLSLIHIFSKNFWISGSKHRARASISCWGIFVSGCFFAIYRLSLYSVVKVQYRCAA